MPPSQCSKGNILFLSETRHRRKISVVGWYCEWKKMIQVDLAVAATSLAHHLVCRALPDKQDFVFFRLLRRCFEWAL
jgi:hypothetical protein